MREENGMAIPGKTVWHTGENGITGITFLIGEL
jgi:hypothetical protein